VPLPHETPGTLGCFDCRRCLDQRVSAQTTQTYEVTANIDVGDLLLIRANTLQWHHPGSGVILTDCEGIYIVFSHSWGKNLLSQFSLATRARIKRLPIG
jgi:hypothetical protein